MRRTSYQKGSLRLADRKKGRVWEFLWREVQLDGSIRRKHIVIGTQEEFPTESAAQGAVDAIRLEINQQTPQQLIKNISFETLVNHYRQHELPDIFNKTKPTELNAQTLPPQFDFAAGHQLQAGVAVPLASFPDGDYKLEIVVTDKIASKSIKRNVDFSVSGS